MIDANAFFYREEAIENVATGAAESRGFHNRRSATCGYEDHVLSGLG
jgi:hypothetical protein